MATIVPFLGMRGTGDWVTNQRPESWRMQILRLYPNGQAPLTALLAMAGSEAVDDPKFHWWTKHLPLQSGAITELYTDAGLSSAYSAGAVTGTTLFAKVAEAVAKEFRAGHTAMFRKAAGTALDEVDYRYDVRAKVTSSVQAGANSYIALRLLQDASATYDLDEATHVMVVGNINAEGAEMPDVITYDPVEYDNVTQIFRTPLSITRTARKTRLRTGPAYQQAKAEALEMHSIEMEKALMWGKKYSGVGANGKPERATDGLVNFILTNNPANVDAYHISADVASSTTWLNGGEDWLNAKLEVIYRYGSPDKMALCGSKVSLALRALAKAGATVNITPVTVQYGIRLMQWDHQFGTLYFKTHPLMNHDPLMRRDMVIFEPKNIKQRTIDDTMFISDPEDRRNRNHSKDATEEEFLTEIGFEYHYPDTMGYLSGFGVNKP